MRKILLLVSCSLFTSGCQQQPAHDLNYTPVAERLDLFATVDGKLVQETWNVHLIHKMKVGHQRTRVYHIGHAPHHKVYRLSEDHLQIRRFGQVTEQSLKMISLETPGGKVLQLGYEVLSGSQSRRMDAVVRDNQLLLRRVEEKVGKSEVLNWRPENGGLFAIHTSLKRTPPQPGERRRVQLFMPVVDRTGQLELVAANWAETELPDGPQRLLRVDVLTNGKPNGEAYWIDEQGEIIKTVHNSVLEITYRANEQLAMHPNDTTNFDVALDVCVPLQSSFPNARDAVRATYRITLQRDDPSEIFHTTDWQRVESESDRNAWLTITNSRIEATQRFDGVDPPTNAERQANRWIQSDDARVQALATAATGTLRNPHEIALALEQYIHRIVNTVDFCQIMATASEVVRQRSGDCSEQAVLLAAAARARNLPARVVVGLIYSPEKKAFLYHMWNEVWTVGRWLPLDATVGQGFVGPDHIKLAHGSLSQETTYGLLTTVHEVVGQLQIELLHAD